MATSESSSTSAFVSAVIFNGLIFFAFLLGFLLLRPEHKRIYQPKTFLESIPENERTEPLPSGWFAWLNALAFKPDVYVLRQTGLDGYFFLRYLKFVIFISCVGIIMLWPILLPVNATGGAGQSGLDLLSFANISNQKRYYAQVFLCWFYFGFILFAIYREFVYFIAVRQAVVTSPQYWNRVSFRTVLFQTVPESYLNERTLLGLFPEARNVWINRNHKDLADKVDERDKLALQLEAAEVKLLKTAVKNKLKGDKKAGADVTVEQGVTIDTYVPQNKRPTKRLKPIVGKKVDTIEYNRSKLAELNPEIKEMQEDYMSAKKLNSVFIEFSSPEAAFDAYQLVAHHLPLHMAPRYIGLHPEDIIWPSLRFLWWERLIRTYATTAFIVVLIIFWAIPVAVVGLISNITYLTDRVHFLRFILNLPPFLYGLVTSLLPTIMLAALMAMLPIILRLMARLAGAPSHSLVEMHVQNSYFAFQVIQVFLVTTIASSASSVVTQIINDPSAATSLLATNLPKSSNFFISYLLLQGLSIGGGILLQIVGLILFRIMSVFLDNTPRKMYNRWSSLSAIGWGTLFPVYTNLAVITITYSIISPVILLFSGVGFAVLYVAYLYNLMYVYQPPLDLTGLGYPRALWQTFTGLYLALVCLLGLFAVGKNWACIVLTAIMLCFTVFFQITLQDAVVPLIDALPKSIEMEHAHSLGLDRSSPAGTNTTPTLTEKSGTNNVIEASTAHEANRKKAKFWKPIFHFLRPDIYSSYLEMKQTMVPDWPVPEYTVEEERGAYDSPAVHAVAPFLWIPRDPYGWSTTEIDKTASVIGISDEGAHCDEKGKIVRDGLPPDYEPVKHL
ncbi:hypothetical protein V1520DRAFT_332324 [Lipomyces starkeyi]|uniref:DUF221 domain-containing protein n=1 Tax=Lipomyces starkeyi NRRL Y-11557 TaxID=675824 RepID=A0A1E3Q9Z7_LIPST|nr:hypothetical protein LIPSTDRAFT_93307 [Lipomyces starkeyi NRRL Y-11557]